MKLEILNETSIGGYHGSKRALKAACLINSVPCARDVHEALSIVIFNQICFPLNSSITALAPHNNPPTTAPPISSAPIPIIPELPVGAAADELVEEAAAAAAEEQLFSPTSEPSAMMGTPVTPVPLIHAAPEISAFELKVISAHCFFASVLSS
jgi:hypothetical protein